MIEASNTAAFALTHLWQSLLIAGVLLGILVLGKRMSGATRYAVAGVALAAAVIGPAAAFLPEAAVIREAKTMLINMVGADRTAQPAAPADGGVRSAVQPDGTIVVAARLPKPAAKTVEMQDGGSLATRAGPSRPGAAAEVAFAPEAGPEAAGAPKDAAADASSVKPAPGFSWPQIALPKLPDLTLPLLAIWSAGTLFMLVRLGLDLAAAERLLRSARPLQLSGDLKRRMGRVRVAVSPQAHGPMAAGVFRPQVILPESALPMLDQPDMAALLEHERAHIERRDIWAALAQRVALAAFWWSPAMHWVSRRIDEERELACDEAAVARTGDARTFARTLTQHAQSHAWARAPRLAVGAMSPRSQLGRRIRALIDMAKIGKVPANYSGRLAFAGLSLALATAIVVTPRIAAQTPPKAPAQSRLPPAKPVSPKAPAAPIPPAGSADLDGGSSGPKIIVRGDGELTEEQEAKIRAALDGLDAHVIIDGRDYAHDRDFEAKLEARIKKAIAASDGDFDFNFGGDFSQFAEFGARIGTTVSAEVLKTLPDVMAEVQRSLDEAGIKWEYDGKGGKVYKLSPEMKAEIDAAMAEAHADVAKAQAELQKEFGSKWKEKFQADVRQTFGPEWKEKVKADVQRAIEESRRARDRSAEAMAQAAAASRLGQAAGRLGQDAAIASLEAQLASRGDQMSGPERRGIQQALEGLRRSRDQGFETVRVAANPADASRQLLGAVSDCDAELAGRLIKAGANVNQTRGGATLLRMAVADGCEGVVDRLLKAGADPNAGGKNPSPLYIAVLDGNEDVVRLLLEHGADANARAPGQDAPLVVAVRDCNEDIVRLLVGRGHADVNVSYTINGKMRTPLQTAIDDDCEECVRILRARGARK